MTIIWISKPLKSVYMSVSKLSMSFKREYNGSPVINVFESK